MNNKKIKIAIIGPFPPPHGGMAVHIERMKKYLEKNCLEHIVYCENKIKKYKNIVNIEPIGSYKKFILQIPFLKSNILHFHTNDFRMKILLGWYKLFGKKIILTIHGETLHDQLTTSNALSRYLLLFSLKKLDKIICVNNKIKKEIMDLGFDAKKINVISAFILPNSDELKIKELPEFFSKIRQKYKFLITANASRLSFYKDQDLYGIDLSIELMKLLLNNGYKNIGFLFIISDVGDHYYYKEMQNLVRKYNLEGIFYFYTKPVAYPAVINMCDLFIRPSNTDGDALSLREALIFKKPAIASDVCKRPKGTILFRNRNVEDLYLKTTSVINYYNEYRTKIKNIELEDNAKKILELYKKVFNEI